jgi:Transposase DDE domain group 1
MATACIAHSVLQVHGISKPIIARFDQPHASSDGGALLPKAVDERLGLTWRLASALRDRRQPGKVAHPLRDLLRQRVFGLAWGIRLQRRRAAGRRPDPQAAARSRSARGRGLGVATDAVAIRERRGPGRSLSARDDAGRHRADLPPRAPGRPRAIHHDRSRCDRRPDSRASRFPPWCAPSCGRGRGGVTRACPSHLSRACDPLTRSITGAGRQCRDHSHAASRHRFAP